MKIKISFIIVPLIIFGVFYSIFFLSSKLQHPEKLLIGTWEEVSRKYEKADNYKGLSQNSSDYIEEVVKHEISKELVIHKSEKWTFDNKSNLYLHKSEGEDMHITWRLLGRGHILKMLYDDGQTKELYNIKELTKDKLVIHFENEIHARGIVKIEFKKIK
jgi:hypothetical protein